MSPELFKYKPYSYKSDIWALGCIIYEICNLKHAFDAQNLNGLAIKILKGNYLPIDSIYSNKLRSLVDQMLNIKPSNRPTIEEIINKPFIKKRIVIYVIHLHKQEPDYDFFLETVRQQCKSLGMWDLVEKYMNRKIERMSASDFMDSQDGNTEIGAKSKESTTKHQILRQKKKETENELRKALTENDRIEEQLKELDKLKNSKDFMSMGKKDRVLVIKKMRKLSDMSEKQQQLEDIRKSNQGNSVRAKQMKAKQIRDSHQVKNALKDTEIPEDEYDDADFEDVGPLNKIKEEEDEDDIDEKIIKYKRRKESNTQNIESLREELKETTQK